MYFILTLMIAGFAGNAGAAVTRAALLDSHDRIARASSDSEAVALRAEYDKLILNAMSEAPPLTQVYAALRDGRMGLTIAKLRFDDGGAWVIADARTGVNAVVPEDEVILGRTLDAGERLVVVDDQGQPAVGSASFEFPGDVIAVGTTLFDASSGRTRPEWPAASLVVGHPVEPGWINTDGGLWPIELVGRHGSRWVYKRGTEYGIVADPIRALKGSRLIGRPVVRLVEGKPKSFVIVAHALDNGAVVTTRGLVLNAGAYALDTDGRIEAHLQRRDRFERFVDVAAFVPMNVLSAFVKGVKAALTRTFVAFTRWRAPTHRPEGLVLSRLPRQLINREKTVGRRLLGGDLNEPLVADARFWALKFGAKTYLKVPGSTPGGAFVTHEDGELVVALHADASRGTRAHEGTHLRNSYDRLVRGRLVARTNAFMVSPGPGFRFLEWNKGSTYQSFFCAEEVHARAVEAGLGLNELSRLDSRPDDQKRKDLRTRVRHKIAYGRSFLTDMNHETAALREAVLGDAGRDSVDWHLAYVDVRRSIVPRGPNEETGRYATMRIYGVTWRMNRDQRVRFALARLDDMEKDNARMARILDHMEKRLIAMGGSMTPDPADCAVMLAGEVEQAGGGAVRERSQ